MAIVLLCLATLAAATIVNLIFKTYRNYRAVCHLGLPVFITPCDVLNPFWALTGPYWTPLLRFCNMHLPSPLNGWFDFIQYSDVNWTFNRRQPSYKLPFNVYSPATFIVSPGSTQMIICDPEAAEDIFGRSKWDFLHSREIYGHLDIFGPNVLSSNGDDWARHRRLTAPPFNERVSPRVWRESLRQAREMLKTWVAKGAKGVANAPLETRALTLHVISACAFGRSYDFTSSDVLEVAEGCTMSYRDALRVVLDNVFAAVFTSIMLERWPSYLVPQSLRRSKTAVDEYKRHILDMLTEEQVKVEAAATETESDTGASDAADMTSSGSSGKGDNLMSVLMKFWRAEDPGKIGLSRDEVLGDFFVYNLAGYETTANSLSYALHLLTIHPKYQEWLAEEINAVFGDHDDDDTWEYEMAFPRLKRCLALLYETVRLYGSILMIVKYTETAPQPLTIASKRYVVPPNIYVMIHAAALHTNPDYWGPDALDFRPDRFIVNASSDSTPNSSPKDGEGEGNSKSEETEELRHLDPGHFMPWAAGPRTCPGKKFSQVEFVAVIAALFRRHRVRPRQSLPGKEGAAEAKRQIEESVADSGMGVTFRMNHPERAELVWEEVSVC